MTKPTFPSPSAGSVLVPREPTEEMIDVILHEHLWPYRDTLGVLSEDKMRDAAEDIYKAMLTAAPAPVLVIELDQKENSTCMEGSESNENANAELNIVEAAKDIVALWQCPNITSLPRSERNAAIEESRARLIKAVADAD